MYSSALHGSRGLLHFLITPCASPVDCGDIPHPPTSRHQSAMLGTTRKDHGYPGAVPLFPHLIYPQPEVIRAIVLEGSPHLPRG